MTMAHSNKTKAGQPSGGISLETQKLVEKMMKEVNH
jgi:hypothetical protein